MFTVHDLNRMVVETKCIKELCVPNMPQKEVAASRTPVVFI